MKFDDYDSHLDARENERFLKLFDEKLGRPARRRAPTLLEEFKKAHPGARPSASLVESSDLLAAFDAKLENAERQLAKYVQAQKDREQQELTKSTPRSFTRVTMTTH